MTVEEKLKERILQNFKSVNAFAAEISVPATTISTMLHKGVGSSGLSLVSKVCVGLDIDISELADGRVEENTDGSLRLISEGERRCVTQYRALDRHGKKVVDTLLEIEYDRVSNITDNSVELPIAARSKSASKQKLTARRDFDNTSLKEEDSEF